MDEFDEKDAIAKVTFARDQIGIVATNHAGWSADEMAKWSRQGVRGLFLAGSRHLRSGDECRTNVQGRKNPP